MADTLLAIALLTTIPASVIVAAYWAAVHQHISRTDRLIPTVRNALQFDEAEALRDADAAPSVCIIVPAHNEAASIGPLVSSIAAQDYPSLHAVFALDRCTDDTASVIRAHAGDAASRIEIIEIDDCPEGWAGKVHAIHTGVTKGGAASAADALLFLDADTMLEPECVRALVALLRARDLGMLSVLSTLTTDRWFEKLVQPMASFELLRQYPVERANRREDRRPFANGQCIMCDRHAYDRVGGHAAVRHELLEDLALARLAAERDVPAGVFFADAMLTCEMYDSWASFRKGWRRIYIEGVKRKPRRLRRAAMGARVLTAWLPALALIGAVAAPLTFAIAPAPVALAAGPIGAVAVAMLVSALVRVARRARVGDAYALLLPYGALLTASILNEAARDLEQRRPTEWAGRHYDRPLR